MFRWLKSVFQLAWSVHWTDSFRTTGTTFCSFNGSIISFCSLDRQDKGISTYLLQLVQIIAQQLLVSFALDISSARNAVRSAAFCPLEAWASLWWGCPDAGVAPVHHRATILDPPKKHKSHTCMSTYRWWLTRVNLFHSGVQYLCISFSSHPTASHH